MHLPKSKLLNVGEIKSAIKSDENPINVFKAALKNTHQQLLKHQHDGVSASQLIVNYTWAIDQLIILAWRMHTDGHANTSLLAVGGYGRGELHPHSDVDLLILLERNNHNELQPVVEPFLRFLWDIGLEIGHSVRSIKDCIKEARANITVMTNMLEMRRLDGDPDLVSKLDEKLRNGRLWPADKYYTAKMAEQQDRHAAYQGTAYSLEPNLKESPGGLRDLQTILWIYNRHFGIRSFAQMKDEGHINNDEYRLLVRARNMLWKLRCALHLSSARREDRLLFDNQRRLAAEYGYEDTKAHLAVEQLMKRYYRTVKLVRYLNDVLLKNYSINYNKWFSIGVSRSLNKDFTVRNKVIEARETDLFKQRPAAILELFCLMQDQEITEIHPDTTRAVRANLKLITAEFRNDPVCKQLFINLFLNANKNHAAILSIMNDYGVLGAYLPCFGTIVGQMQHDLFHVYTVDAHTLMVINNIAMLPQNKEQFPLPYKLLEPLYKTERLYIAALFHDIAKGRGGDHSILGEADAYKFCIEHGLSDYDAKLVGWLVRNHLVMSHFSQRRDISDPEVISEFAEIVGDHEYLDNLYILTHADIRGTSPKVWNAWKGQLLKDLYTATSQALHRGLGKPINENEHVAEDKAAAIKQLETSLGVMFTKGVRQRVEEFWTSLRNDYFIRNEPYYIAWHAATLCTQNVVDLPIISVRYSERLEANMVFIFAAKSSTLLTRVTRAFDDLEFNIIEAQLQGSRTGYALYSFNAIGINQNALTNVAEQKDLAYQLRQRIMQSNASKLIFRRSMSRALKHFPIETIIQFSQTHSKYTVMEVIAQDQPGLLHNVAFILERHNVILVSAKVATFGARAEDVFFIQMPNETPVLKKDLLREIEQDLCAGLSHTTSL